MTDAGELDSVEKAVGIGTQAQRNGDWFRGHARACGQLIPRIFRPPYIAALRRDPRFECSLIQEFKRVGNLMIVGPQPENTLQWMFLMQHHGAPTRLLDWTENVLVALYFAVEEEPEEDGELWILKPLVLNRASTVLEIPSAGAESDTLRRLVDQPCAELGTTDFERLKYPLAIRPTMTDPRMISQIAAFTIHPNPPDDGSVEMSENLSDAEASTRYIIRRSNKRKLFRDVAALGITRRTIYGDLDALAKTIVATEINKEIPPKNNV